MLVNPVKRDFQVLKATRDQLDHLDQPVYLASPVFQGHLDQRGLSDPMETLVIKEPEGQRGKMDRTDLVVPQDREVQLESRDLLDLLARRVLMVRRAELGRLVSLDHPDRLDLREERDQMERVVFLAKLVRKERMATSDLKVPRGRLDLPDQRETKDDPVLKVLLDLLVILEGMVCLALTVSPVKMAPQGDLALRGKMDHRAFLARLDLMER